MAVIEVEDQGNQHASDHDSNLQKSQLAISACENMYLTV